MRDVTTLSMPSPSRFVGIGLVAVLNGAISAVAWPHFGVQVKSMLLLAPKLSETLMENQLLRHFAKNLKSMLPSAGYTLARIAKILQHSRHLCTEVFHF